MIFKYLTWDFFLPLFISKLDQSKIDSRIICEQIGDVFLCANLCESRTIRRLIIQPTVKTMMLK
ncbi:hypothetical protein BpHYR1_051025 [Brachionus plicatilis]|uniref:Uncharacterized protein n=1 Tax=Brachionus plicatilis TaxID=10195 RepID=A0A3M7SR33_BRAPC|nr:hypothetical protein BpHYR1_051025 [Brachionus plicatilis]